MNANEWRILKKAACQRSEIRADLQACQNIASPSPVICCATNVAALTVRMSFRIMKCYALLIRSI